MNSKSTDLNEDKAKANLTEANLSQKNLREAVTWETQSDGGKCSYVLYQHLICKTQIDNS